MNDFEKILRMTQKELKSFLKGYLTDCGYNVIDEDGFLYAEGNERVLLVAHMDRYPESHKDNVDFKHRYPVPAERVTEIEKTIANGRTIWSSPQGICADDRAGVWCIMQLIKKYPASVLFTECEEKSCIGAKKFCWTDYVKNLNVNYMIQIDRCGSSDAAFYNCKNDMFKQFIHNVTNYRIVDGNSTDIRYIMPISNIAGVNFSCGYYNEHYASEYVVIEDMQHTLNIVEHLLEQYSDRAEGAYEACVSTQDYKDVIRRLEEYRPQK